MSIKADQYGENDRQSLKEAIKVLKNKPWMKPVLEMLNKRCYGRRKESIPTFPEELCFSEVAQEIGKKILSKKGSVLTTSSALGTVATNLQNLALFSDMLTERFPEEDEPPDHKSIRQKFRDRNKLFRGLIDSSAQTHQIRYPENVALSRLAENVKAVSDEYYNKHPIETNYWFEKDDDMDATPGTLFSWKRITDFVHTLPDDRAKHLYLLKIRRKLVENDQSGNIRIGGNEVFSGDRDRDLHRKLDDKIGTFERMAIAASPKELDKGSNKSIKKHDFTARRKILILLLLTFHKLELPESLVKERVVEFYHGLVGGDIGKLREILKNPTQHKGGKRSVALLCDDLYFAKERLGTLGLSDNVKAVVAEIQFIIDELNGKTEEE